MIGGLNGAMYLLTLAKFSFILSLRGALFIVPMSFGMRRSNLKIGFLALREGDCFAKKRLGMTPVSRYGAILEHKFWFVKGIWSLFEDNGTRMK